MEKKTIKIRSVFIRSIVAQYELFISCMHFITMRKQVHICFYQFDFQSGIRLVKKPSFEIFNFFDIKLKFYIFYNDLT